MLTAYLDEVLFKPGMVYSRRPRIRVAGLEVVATRRSDAVVCAMCRKLIDAGHDLEVFRGATLALRIRSIGRAAKFTVSESGGRPHFVPFKPFHREQDALNGDEASEDADDV